MENNESEKDDKWVSEVIFNHQPIEEDEIYVTIPVEHLTVLQAENERLRLLLNESKEWIIACDGQYTDLHKRLTEALNKD